MIDTAVKFSGIEPYKKVNQITKTERRHLAELLKDMRFTVKSLRPIKEAIITRAELTSGRYLPKLWNQS